MTSKPKLIIISVLIAILLAIPSIAKDLSTYRERAQSDDAKSIDEAFFHGEARALIIMEVQSNKLGVGGREFRVKRNPVGEGCFVYDPRTVFRGIKRNIVWFVLDEKNAYALNSPSKMITPSLKWPREDGLNEISTLEVIGYVFENKPMPPMKKDAPITQKNKENSFTVNEYRIYKSIVNTPMSITEAQAFQDAAKHYGLTAAEVKKATIKIQKILSQNNWFGPSEAEIKHASNWNGERQ